MRRKKWLQQKNDKELIQNTIGGFILIPIKALESNFHLIRQIRDSWVPVTPPPPPSSSLWPTAPYPYPHPRWLFIFCFLEFQATLTRTFMGWCCREL